MKTFKIIGFALFFICLIFYVYYKYDERAFLRYGVLKLKEYPPSFKMLDYKTEGVSDFHAAYSVSISKEDFGKLLAGRTYTKEKADSLTILNAPISEPSDFLPRYRFYSGTLHTGIAVIFVNTDYTKVFVEYWVD